MLLNFMDGLRTNKRKTKWRLFHATDFESLIYPNLTLSKILGIFPYRIKASSFKLSKPRYILWTIIFCVICVYELTELYKLNFSGRSKSNTTDTISLNFSLLYGMFITAISYIFSRLRMHLLHTISDISSNLSQQSYHKLSKLIHVKDIFGFFYLFWRGSLFVTKSGTIIDIFLQIPRVYITLLAFQMDMLYVNCVCVLKACFKEVNDNLENLQELMLNNTPRWIYHKQRYLFSIKLKTLQKQHLMISSTVQMLNVIFSLHLLATIVLSFKQIIFLVYFYVVQWQDRISFKLNSIYNMYFMVYVLYYFIRIALIVWVCETSKNQAEKIRTTIHDVLNSTNNVQVKDELRLFSLQILHCKNTFSAKGFTVDATLLTGIMSGITTYILILIQFLGISHSCDEKTAINITETI